MTEMGRLAPRRSILSFLIINLCRIYLATLIALAVVENAGCAVVISTLSVIIPEI